MICWFRSPLTRLSRAAGGPVPRSGTGGRRTSVRSTAGEERCTRTVDPETVRSVEPKVDISKHIHPVYGTKGIDELTSIVR